MVKEDVVNEFDYKARAKLAKPYLSEVFERLKHSSISEEKEIISLSKSEIKDIVKKFEKKVGFSKLKKKGNFLKNKSSIYLLL